MNNLSEYIPLLFILVFILISIRKGAGKKQEEMTKTTLPGRKSGEIINIPEVVSVKKTKEKIKAPKPVHPSMMNPDEQIMPIEMDDSNEFGEAVLNIEDIEDIKKAVIYTEIFNRKDY
jgi:hypothetical protein